MIDGLKKIDVGSLKRLDLPGMKPPKRATGPGVDATVGLEADRVLATRFTKHAHEFQAGTRAAVTLLKRLPDPGEVMTVLMSGAFDGWDFVSGTLALAAPATIAELYVATLGFSDENSGQLIGQIDAGSIGSVWFVASCLMRDGAHGGKFSRLADGLTRRGSFCRGTRNHAKILAMKLTDGRTICVDGSCNFCRCSSVEQAHVWNDPDLFAFYAAYISEQATATGRVR